MDELGGSRGSPGREILALNEPHTEPPARGIEGNARACRSPADDEQIEGFDGAGSHQRRPLNFPRRHSRRGIGDLPPKTLQRGAAAGIVLGCRRITEDHDATAADGGSQSPDDSQPKCHHPQQTGVGKSKGRQFDYRYIYHIMNSTSATESDEYIDVLFIRPRSVDSVEDLRYMHYWPSDKASLRSLGSINSSLRPRSTVTIQGGGGRRRYSGSNSIVTRHF